MDKAKYSASCRDAGVECDYQVCDSDEDEVINSIQDHARRAHAKDLTSEQIRPLVKSGAPVCQ